MLYFVSGSAFTESLLSQRFAATKLTNTNTRDRERRYPSAWLGAGTQKLGHAVRHGNPEKIKNVILIRSKHINNSWDPSCYVNVTNLNIGDTAFLNWMNSRYGLLFCMINVQRIWSLTCLYKGKKSRQGGRWFVTKQRRTMPLRKSGNYWWSSRGILCVINIDDTPGVVLRL